MRTCERGTSYDSICGKKAGWVKLVNIVEWKDGRPGAVVDSRLEYLCDEHAAWHRKMGQPVKKLHVLAVG